MLSKLLSRIFPESLAKGTKWKIDSNSVENALPAVRDSPGEDGLVGSPHTQVRTVKFEALVAVPAAVVTFIFPVVAPVGTVTVSFVDVSLVTRPALPLNVTDFGAWKLVPVMTTDVPGGPEDGVNPAMVGPGTVNSVALVAGPLDVETVM